MSGRGHFVHCMIKMTDDTQGLMRHYNLEHDCHYDWLSGGDFGLMADTKVEPAKIAVWSILWDDSLSIFGLCR